MRGFTLVEMMVATAVATVIGAALLMTVRSGQQTWESGQSRMAVSQELRRGVEAMARELAATQAGQVVIVNGSSITFAVPEDGADAGTTVLDDTTGALEWSAPITYALGGDNGNQLIRTQGADSRVLANGVQAVDFLLQDNVLEMAITVEQGLEGSFQNQATLNTRVRLRN